MLHLSPSCRYYLYAGNADMRKGFNSLSGMVSSQMQLNVLDGSVFIFMNKKHNQIKLLLWEGDGLLCITSAWRKELMNCLRQQMNHLLLPSVHNNCSLFCRAYRFKKYIFDYDTKELPELFTFSEMIF